MKKLIFLIVVTTLLFYSMTCRKIQEVYIESDLRPIDGFDQTEIQAIAVLNFDASAIKTKEVDKIALRDAITYDIIKNLYEQKKVRVIQGQAIQGVQEKEVVQMTKGDYETAVSTIERLVSYKYNPYQKVDAILTGKVTDYEVVDEDNPGYNYIEMLVQLVDSVDGTMYWVTKIKGNYKDVIYTITHTISSKVYTEPALPSTSLGELPSPTVPPVPGTK